MKSRSGLNRNFAHLREHDERLLRPGTAQKTVETLTTATLAKAFRGDLVPQDPNNEPAKVLPERQSTSAPTSPTKLAQRNRAKHI